ncbi:hypothetical protein H6P81_005683 [Aristolochia fimbriata]|uniref:Uncharacterized protein n=1 Tax=Aristolochia fimbriata TaxID=158543 RepID=A0AAV7EWB1_ARIFI|nr:hypothetical protein H6P81_005683 [Aristolochia fimbriata]
MAEGHFNLSHSWVSFENHMGRPMRRLQSRESHMNPLPAQGRNHSEAPRMRFPPATSRQSVVHELLPRRHLYPIPSMTFVVDSIRFVSVREILIANGEKSAGEQNNGGPLSSTVALSIYTLLRSFVEAELELLPLRLSPTSFGFLLACKMNYVNRVWMAATVAVAQSHTDHGFKWNSGMRSFQMGKGGIEAAVSRPLSTLSGFEFESLPGEEGRRLADESLQKAMYLTCWGQS